MSKEVLEAQIAELIRKLPEPPGEAIVTPVPLSYLGSQGTEEERSLKGGEQTIVEMAVKNALNASDVPELRDLLFKRPRKLVEKALSLAYDGAKPENMGLESGNKDKKGSKKIGKKSSDKKEPFLGVNKHFLEFGSGENVLGSFSGSDDVVLTDLSGVSKTTFRIEVDSGGDVHYSIIPSIHEGTVKKKQSLTVSFKLQMTQAMPVFAIIKIILDNGLTYMLLVKKNTNL